MKQANLYINGEFVSTNDTYEVVNPATNEVVATVAKGGEKEAKLAADAAYEAFQTWSKKTAEERGKLLFKWHQLIEEHTDELAEIMTVEQGKPLKEAKGEIGYANGFVSWYAEEGKRIYGETIPASSPNKRLFAHKQPVGVMAAITPAEQTPLTALRLAELAEEAGIPKGVINVVTGDAKAIGEAWLQDGRVRKLSFTGSTEVGKLLMRGAADTVKKVSLELGGHAPFIVTANADLDKAVTNAIASKFRNAGQTCVCTNRIYVHESIAKPFAEQFAAAVSQLKVGNGLEEGTDIGPLIDEKALEKVKRHLDDVVAKGGNVLTGGAVREEGSGLFVEPTVVDGATDDMLCMYEETFGPIAPIATYQTEEEVIRRANNSPYGLAAYVFTENISEAIRIAEALEYGIVGLNDGLPSTPQAPFGGFKESGLGREGGHYGIEEYLEVKYISLGF